MNTMNSMNTMNWVEINKNPLKFTKNLELLEEILIIAAEKYYTGTPVLSDYTYDILIDILEGKEPNNKLLKKIGFKSSNDKIKLPVFMGSMNKIKTNDELSRWVKKYFNGKENDFVISEKLDGISILLTYYDNNIKLYTRGNGTHGRDITFLKDYIKIPDNINKSIESIEASNLVLRGELIIAKHNFIDYINKLADNAYNKSFINYSSARNMVIGLVNSKTYNPLFSILDMVIYEVIEPQLKPPNQFIFASKLGFNVCQNKIATLSDIVKWKDLKDNYLFNLLKKYKLESKYELDGIIITHNNLYKREEKNPKNSIAFKSNNDGCITTIKDIVWAVSKYNVIIPRIHFNKINLGSEIEYCTGFNGKYIFDNSLGPGSTIRVVLSGDVIPYICEIITTTYPKMPPINYTWSKNKLHCISLEKNIELRKKRILHFIKTIKIEHLSIGIINKLFENGFESLDKILCITKEQLLTIDGIKDTLASKIYSSIHIITDKPIYLGTLMVASLEFNSGMGIKKIDKILEKYPNIIDGKDENILENINNISSIDGLHEKTAQQFIENLGNFKEFIGKHHYLKYYTKNTLNNINNSIKNINNKIKNKKFVLTGFRDKEFIKYLIDNSGIIQNTVNGKTDYLIIKNKLVNSTKIDKAKELGVDILTINECKTLLYIK